MAEERGTRRYASLDDALAGFRMPAGNHEFIKKYLVAIDPIGFYPRGGYIKVIRRDGGPAVQIHTGYATGFQSEAELRLTVGDEAEVWESDRGTGLWGVTHPNSQRERARGATGSSSAPSPAEAKRAVPVAEPERELCLECFELRSLTGQCSCS